jgi:hypothetical protein
MSSLNKLLDDVVPRRRTNSVTSNQRPRNTYFDLHNKPNNSMLNWREKKDLTELECQDYCRQIHVIVSCFIFIRDGMIAC